MTGQYIYSAPLENAMKDIARALNRIANLLEAQEQRARAAEQVARDMDAQGFVMGDEPCG